MFFENLSKIVFCLNFSIKMFVVSGIEKKSNKHGLDTKNFAKNFESP